jgi:hypothetical protein
MDTALLVVLVLVVIGTFVLAYFAFKTTWHWPHVTLVVLNILMAIVFLGISARTLKTQNAWRETVALYERYLGEREAWIKQRVEGVPGDPTQPGLDDLREQLFRATVERGEVWRNLTPGRADVRTGAMVLTVDPQQEAKHGLTEKSVLYLFSAGSVEEGGVYIGKYRVTKTDAKTATVEPAATLTDLERSRLSKARAPWIGYYILPADSPAFLKSLSPADLEQLAAKLSPDAKALLTTHDRLPVDFSQELDYRRMQQDLLVHDAGVVNDQLDRMTKSSLEAQDGVKYRQSELVALKADLEKFRYEQEQTRQLLTRVTTYLNQQRAELKQTLATTQQLAQQLAAQQGGVILRQ